MTRAFTTRLRDLEGEYRSKITKYFEVKRTIARKGPAAEREALVTEIQKAAEKLAKKMHPDARVQISDRNKQNPDYYHTIDVEISYSYEIDVRKNESFAKIDTELKTCVADFCPQEKRFHQLLHDWKEQCLLTGDLIAFEYPVLSEEEIQEVNTIGCNG